jgi:recombinational DNA repair ATPase RecF
VMSELDATRRHTLLDALAGADQAIVTTTDWGDFSEELLGQANRLTIERGALAEANGRVGEREKGRAEE